MGLLDGSITRDITKVVLRPSLSCFGFQHHLGAVVSFSVWEAWFEVMTDHAQTDEVFVGQLDMSMESDGSFEPQQCMRSDRYE